MKYLISVQCFLLILVVLISCSKNKDFIVREVVLTFDDAPGSPVLTVETLDVLLKHQTRATFFCHGQSLRTYPEVAKRIAAEQDLANHTYTHIDVGNSDLIQIYKDEIQQTQHIIDSLQPGNKRYFRPPFGSLTLQQKSTLINNGFIIAMWDLGANDWKGKASLQDILDYYHKNLGSEAQIPIILFHFNESSAQALDILLTEFEAENIKVISLDDYQTRKH
jgi:peptidoglycan/xylan/chitin deacetylase (PgdA/CDA1 family)